MPLAVALLRLPVLVGGALRARRAAARALPRVPLGAAVLVLAWRAAAETSAPVRALHGGRYL